MIKLLKVKTFNSWHFSKMIDILTTEEMLKEMKF